MAKRASKPKPKPNNREKNGRTPHDPTRPIGNKNPPVETQIKPGEVRNPHGRPRTLAQLRQLVQDIAAEPLDSNPNWSRLYAMLRGMFSSKSNSDRITLLEYAFGKVPQPTHNMNAEEWREWMLQNGYSESEANAAFSGMVNAAAEATVLRDADAPSGANGGRGHAGSEGAGK